MHFRNIRFIKYKYLIAVLIFSIHAIAGSFHPLHAQEKYGYIKGVVYNDQSGEFLPDATIIAVETSQVTESDEAGQYILGPLESGKYTLKIIHLGFENKIIQNVSVKAGEIIPLEIRMIVTTNTLDELTVYADPFKKGIDVPASLHSLLTTEIQRNPGADNDISKVIRTMPGVTTMSAFRNDLIIRGGAPNENRFFLDDIEIPVINHLVTQGASGGAYSIINARQLREVDYMSSAFPANRGNALSSVFDFRLRDGNTDSLSTSLWLGGTEAGASMEGPLGNDAGFLLSARRSYRQYVLQMLKFAFLPVYNDFTGKLKISLNPRSSITLLGIGAVDDFKLNENVGNDEVQLYLLDNLPASQQSNYTIGAVYRYYSNNSLLTIVGSRSGLKNKAEKYFQNDPSTDENLILKYNSGEYSNRARIEYAYSTPVFRIMVGSSLDDMYGNYDVFNRIFNQYGPVTVDYVSNIRLQQYSLYSQMNIGMWNNRVSLTIGGRTDASNYNTAMQNPLDHLSGRANLNIGISNKTTLNFGIANYYQLPPMMTLSYQNSGELDNKEIARYLQSLHYVAGIKMESNFASRLSIEGFYKRYPGYMMSLRDSISLAHQPVDFGVYGNYPVDFNSDGRAYGVEVFYQQRLYRGFYGMLAYTLSWSEYKDKQGTYVPSTWDARHILNATLGKRIGDKWEVGMNWRMQSAFPYTPFDVELSSMRPVWDVNNQGIRDNAFLNTERGKATNIISARVDRIYKFPKWTLNVFMDLENITADTDSQQALILDRMKDENGNFTGSGIILNPDAPYEEQQYKLKGIQNAQGAFIPTFGFIASF